MIILSEYYWIFFIFFVFVVFFRNAKHKLKRKLNKTGIVDNKELFSFFKRASWLWRVSIRETRRLYRRQKYLGRLRKKAVKRFGCDSGQVELIDRWTAEVHQYIKHFSHISNTATDLSSWANESLNENL